MNALIAIHIPNLNSNIKLFYESFKKKKNNKYSFPTFHNKIPEGYSLFCTSSEENSIYIKEEDDSNIFSSNKEIDNDIEPIGNYCELCHKKFLSYEIHSKSKEHIHFMRKQVKQYKNICNTFKRINSYYNSLNNDTIK